MMTPRTLQIIAHLQRAQQESTAAANLLLQELAEAKTEPEKEEENKDNG